MIKTIFFDLDGTLYSHTQKRVPSTTLYAFELLKKQGIKRVLCTGRHVRELEQLGFFELGLDFDGYILLNGQIILDKDLNYIDDYVRYVHDTVNLRMPEVKEYDGQEIYQALAYGKVKDYIEKELPDFMATSWHFDGVDIVPKDSGKDKGIIEYCKLRNIDIKDTMAFGDGENDIEMLKTVGIGVAMGNSIDIVKENADYITDRIEEDGLYKALRHYEVIDD